MSNRILQHINNFVTFGDSAGFSDWQDLAGASLKAIGVLAVAWPLAVMALL